MLQSFLAGGRNRKRSTRLFSSPSRKRISKPSITITTNFSNQSSPHATVSQAKTLDHVIPLHAYSIIFKFSHKRTLQKFSTPRVVSYDWFYLTLQHQESKVTSTKRFESILPKFSTALYADLEKDPNLENFIQLPILLARDTSHSRIQ